LFPCILCEKYIHISALEMASPENGTVKLLWFEIRKMLIAVSKKLILLSYLL